jgi:hypothetical protein
MIQLWKRLPEWAQWCLYLPCCVLFPALAGGMVSLPTLYHGASKASLAIVLPLTVLVATVVFYWCAFYLAPRAKKIAAGILYVIFMLLWMMTALHSVIGWYMNSVEVDFLSVMELIRAVIAITAGSFLFVAGFRNPQSMQL